MKGSFPILFSFKYIILPKFYSFLSKKMEGRKSIIFRFER